MRRFFVLFIATLLVAVSGLSGQDQPNNNRNKPTYRSWVKSLNGGELTEGYLYFLEDSLLDYVEKPMPPSYSNNMLRYPVQDIEYLQFRRKGGGGIGAVVGALVGFGTGYMIASNQVKDAELENAQWLEDLVKDTAKLGTGVLVAIPGAVIGAVIGGTRITIPINGNQRQYESQLKKLEKYRVSN